MQQQLRSPMTLVRFEGKFWWWTGLTDRRGWYDLINPMDGGTGVNANPAKVQLVVEPELSRQLDAIDYFARQTAIM